MVDDQNFSASLLFAFLNFEGHRKASLHVDLRAVNASEERAHDGTLAFGASQVVIEDVRHDGRVDVAVERARMNSKVQVGQVRLLRNLLQFCLVHARRIIRLHKCFFSCLYSLCF